MECPTCGGPVTVVSDSGEGTSFYHPLEGRAKKGEPACEMCGAKHHEQQVTVRPEFEHENGGGD